VMDVPGILKAGGDNALYWIVEMDRVAPELNAMTEVKKSYQYLKRLA